MCDADAHRFHFAPVFFEGDHVEHRTMRGDESVGANPRCPYGERCFGNHSTVSPHKNEQIALQVARVIEVRQ